MAAFIDINNDEQLQSMLQNLRTETMPRWGKMNARQMVEHLIENVQCTNGKIEFSFTGNLDEAIAAKQIWIYTDREIPKNLFLGELPGAFAFEDIETAKCVLLEELALFHQQFHKGKISEDHLGYGPLTYQEWQIWHGKHFTHHFKQFGLF